MKKYLAFVVLLFISTHLIAQPLCNEWIDYSKVYYKFKVGANGLYRINQATLANVGLANTNAAEFQLWRNGVQVPIYTSVTGIFTTSDFIEFWGEMNDGKLDKNLYRNAADQLSDKLSLLTDTAAYFLTTNKIASQNLRYTIAANNVTGNALPAEPYFNYILRVNFRDKINRGDYTSSSEAIYSSSYVKGEFLSTNDITVGNGKYNVALNNLYVYAAGSAATLTTGICGASATKSRNVFVDINGTNFITKNISAVNASINTASVPLSIFNGATDVATFRIVSGDLTQDSIYDRAIASYLELQYQRQFNFDNKTNFEFTIQPSTTNKYLRITNFNYGTIAPVLYDITHLQYYVADISTTGVVQFVLPASGTATNYVLVSRSNNNIKEIATLETRNFIDYSLVANQADYIIISNKILTTSTNPVNQYKEYRKSINGGSYNANVYDIDDLLDQFAYGIKKHPLSVRNFLRLAKTNFATQPKYVFIIGKAVTYDNYHALESTYGIEQQNLVPTFGWPASDALLVSADNSIPAPMLSFGRLSAINTQEVADYLDKVKQYETQGASTTQTIANKAWMKNAVHVAGADDPNLDQLLTSYLNSYEAVYRDSSTCGNVTLLSKTSGSAINTTQSDISKLFENGISLLTYFGHSAASGLAYNLNEPNDYNNYGKYPVFLVNGCSAGNFYDFDTIRFLKPTSLAERFVFIKNKGSIAFIATSHFGFTSYLDYYSKGFYNSLSKLDYGKSIGQNMLTALANLKNLTNNFNDVLGRNHGEQFLLHGDPAIKIYESSKPDFVVEDPQVSINPTFISVLDNSFNVKANIYNIGKGTGDSVRILVKRQYPNGVDSILINKNIVSIKYIDSSINLTIPINPVTDKGKNTITVTVDVDNKYDELSETNNTVTKEFVVFEDELKPVYPYNYSIINKQNIKLAASTANVFASQRQYIMELDTTTLFNSAFKVTKIISSVGGLLEFDPAITFKDSTVYYWRVAAVSATGDNHWGNSSFVYLQNAISNGFNQSHFYQHCNSSLNNLVADTAARLFSFPTINNTLTIRNCVWPYNEDVSVAVNDASNPRTYGTCWRTQNITFTVYNPSTLQEMFNSNSGNPGQYGSLFYTTGCIPGKEYDFAFSTVDVAGRKAAMDFMDNIIPNNSYVVVRSIILDNINWPSPTFANDWKQDELIYGTGNSLYHRLQNVGFSDVDSFNRKRAFAFVYQKNNNGFTPVSKFTNDINDVLTLKVATPTKPTTGTMISPAFGPATKWHNMLWMGNRNDLADIVSVKLLGIKTNNTVDTLYTYTEVDTSSNISAVSAATYPYLKIYMQVKDTVNLTAYQLKYWRLLADVVPEGAIMPISFVFKDTLQKGESQDVAIAFKNISNTAYSDSLDVKLTVTDNNNIAKNIAVSKLKKLLPGNVDTIKTVITSQNFVGTNTFYVNVNPTNTPQEQTLTNNFAYKKFFVFNDNINPVLDVTFDGVHILNGDVVSSKPNIHIALKDEAKYLLLNDTSAIKLQLKFPDGTIRQYKYDNDTLRFIPASNDGKNTATAEFEPTLLVDGTYELFVQSKDKSENLAGPQQYRVLFTVNNKPMISNVFNYPNPFTTSTAFVFTLTGSQIPNNLRIQILTVTGKIVKEITKAELGNIHIGRNITDYKWDGTDMYGQALGNGVYLYRVITSLDGKALDKYNVVDNYGNETNTDSYFKAGYGKMYLMR